MSSLEIRRIENLSVLFKYLKLITELAAFPGPLSKIFIKKKQQQINVEFFAAKSSRENEHLDIFYCVHFLP
jgi:hypothetical protein